MSTPSRPSSWPQPTTSARRSRRPWTKSRSTSGPTHVRSAASIPARSSKKSMACSSPISRSGRSCTRPHSARASIPTASASPVPCVSSVAPSPVPSARRRISSPFLRRPADRARRRAPSASPTAAQPPRRQAQNEQLPPQAPAFSYRSCRASHHRSHFRPHPLALNLLVLSLADEFRAGGSRVESS